MITPGMILIEKGTVVPNESFSAGTPLLANWMSISIDRASLERRLTDAGWTLFYMAGEITATAFGFDRERRLRAAVGRMLRQVESEHCNCIEIGSVGIRSFLGIPYSTIAAHARHIQDSSLFRGR